MAVESLAELYQQVLRQFDTILHRDIGRDDDELTAVLLKLDRIRLNLKLWSTDVQIEESDGALAAHEEEMGDGLEDSIRRTLGGILRAVKEVDASLGHGHDVRPVDWTVTAATETALTRISKDVELLQTQVPTILSLAQIRAGTGPAAELHRRLCRVDAATRAPEDGPNRPSPRQAYAESEEEEEGPEKKANPVGHEPSAGANGETPNLEGKYVSPSGDAHDDEQTGPRITTLSDNSSSEFTDWGVNASSSSASTERRPAGPSGPASRDERRNTGDITIHLDTPSVNQVVADRANNTPAAQAGPVETPSRAWTFSDPDGEGNAKETTTTMDVSPTSPIAPYEPRREEHTSGAFGYRQSVYESKQNLPGAGIEVGEPGQKLIQYIEPRARATGANRLAVGSPSPAIAPEHASGPQFGRPQSRRPLRESHSGADPNTASKPNKLDETRIIEQYERRRIEDANRKALEEKLMIQRYREREMQKKIHEEIYWHRFERRRKEEEETKRKLEEKVRAEYEMKKREEDVDRRLEEEIFVKYLRSRRQRPGPIDELDRRVQALEDREAFDRRSAQPDIRVAYRTRKDVPAEAEKRLEEEMSRRLRLFGFQENQIQAILHPETHALKTPDYSRNAQQPSAQERAAGNPPTVANQDAAVRTAVNAQSQPDVVEVRSFRTSVSSTSSTSSKDSKGLRDNHVGLRTRMALAVMALLLPGEGLAKLAVAAGSNTRNAPDTRSVHDSVVSLLCRSESGEESTRPGRGRLRARLEKLTRPRKHASASAASRSRKKRKKATKKGLLNWIKNAPPAGMPPSSPPPPPFPSSSAPATAPPPPPPPPPPLSPIPGAAVSAKTRPSIITREPPAAPHLSQMQSGMPETGPSHRRPTYIKVHRDHLMDETLSFYGIPWEQDKTDPDHIMLLRELDQHETDAMFAHTRRLRERNASPTRRQRPQLLLQEGSRSQEAEFPWQTRRPRVEQSPPPRRPPQIQSRRSSDSIISMPPRPAPPLRRRNPEEMVQYVDPPSRPVIRTVSDL